MDLRHQTGLSGLHHRRIMSPLCPHAPPPGTSKLWDGKIFQTYNSVPPYPRARVLQPPSWHSDLGARNRIFFQKVSRSIGLGTSAPVWRRNFHPLDNKWCPPLGLGYSAPYPAKFWTTPPAVVSYRQSPGAAIAAVFWTDLALPASGSSPARPPGIPFRGTRLPTARLQGGSSPGAKSGLGHMVVTMSRPGGPTG